MNVPISYIVRNLLRRFTATILTVSSFGLVVFSLLILLAMVEGVNEMLIASGAPDRVLAYNENVTSENHSQLTQSDVRAVSSLDAVRLTAEGTAYASAEVVKTAYAMSPRGDRIQVNFRGVQLSTAMLVHDQLRIIAGRLFNPGAENEVILGRQIHLALGVEPGGCFEAQKATWCAVGVFEENGSTAESEIWTSKENIALAYDKSSISSIWIRVRDSALTERVVEQLNANAALSVYATTEQDHYAEGLAAARGLQVLAWVIAGIMAVGAVFSAMNTMYASIADRAGELAALRALGFRARSVLFVVLIEALIIALTGGILACMLGWTLDGTTVRTLIPGLGVIGFQFMISMRLLGTALLFSLALGFFGGWIPARYATRMNIVQALNG